jgi:4-amino-4-deoxy-L-arabinose transferase-like glycosyltransferase
VSDIATEAIAPSQEARERAELPHRAPPTAQPPTAAPELGPRALLYVLAFAILVRVLYMLGAWLVSGESAFYGLDSGTYIEPARELLRNGVFARLGQPELQRTPGFSLLLIPALLTGHFTLAVLASNVVLSALTVLGVYVLARSLFGDARVAVTAAALYSIEPFSIQSTAVVASETTFTAMTTWALVLIVGYACSHRPRDLLAGIALLAASAYVRPAGYYLPFLLVAFLVVVALTRRAWNRLPPLALAAALAVAIVLPWHLRNRSLGNSGFSAAGATILYFANGAAVTAARAGVSFAEMQAAMGNLDDERYLRLHPEQRNWRWGDRYTYMQREGTKIIRQNLPLYARIHAAGMARVAFDPGAIDLLRPYGLYPKSGGLLNRMVTYGIVNAVAYLFQANPVASLVLVVLGLFLLALYVLALGAVLTRRRFLDPSVLLLVLSIGYFVAIAGGPIGYGRFRHPAMPLVCVLAAAGLYTATARARRRGAEAPRAGGDEATGEPTMA